MTTDSSEPTVYDVVVNEEEQYSIWPADREPPAGWTLVGRRGPQQECLQYIASVWTDLRPRSLRDEMAAWSREAPVEEPEPAQDPDPVPPLVDRLGAPQPVEIDMRTDRRREALCEALSAQLLYVRFPGTRGRTELPLALDPAACETARTGIQQGAPRLHLSGRAVLDDVPVQCAIDVSLDTFTGTGSVTRGPS